jgi:hypothetical protein
VDALNGRRKGREIVGYRGVQLKPDFRGNDQPPKIAFWFGEAWLGETFEARRLEVFSTNTNVAQSKGSSSPRSYFNISGTT